ncbi:hypothetical protein KIH39_24975 [Telmatocola sphagniphila]|uniref:Uncharacterized protein n=1 Tax=Telmatocola sphagniphila TaxID=1123043 RepID=A0A8E6EUZ4_9BACT|nr:hypothetical protein [Telmatocola sphagniphila]QVL32050.1 hypothetical protein KIH39_24975 [Telmatocola sphagniphila]
MFRRSCVLVVLCSLLIYFSASPTVFAQTKAKSNSPLAGFTLKKLHGFNVYVSDEVLKHQNSDEYEVKPLEALDQELQTIIQVMKAEYVVKLRRLPIFVEWDGSAKIANDRAVAAYFPNDRERGNNVSIVKMSYITKVYQPDNPNEECVILHEFAHAVDHAIYNYQQPQIVKAYQVAMDRKLYGDPPSRGQPAKVYAATSAREYFAELTCSYLDKGRKPIVTREDLKTLDPEGYKAMEQIWGKNPELFVMRPKKKAPVATNKETKTEAKRPAEKPPEVSADTEKLAANKLKAIQFILDAGKQEAAKEKLDDLIKQFPMTEAAKKAAEIRKTLSD